MTQIRTGSVSTGAGYRSGLCAANEQSESLAVNMKRFFNMCDQYCPQPSLSGWAVPAKADTGSLCGVDCAPAAAGHVA